LLEEEGAFNMTTVTSESSKHHAIVIGGSIAGLAAARVLADHFEQVTVIERDHLPDGPEFRNGVPQGRQPHALLLRGKQILEDFFPGLFDELRTEGAIDVNFGTDFAWFAFGHWRPHYNSELVTPALSRPLLEHGVYRRLATWSNVRFEQQAEVSGLVASPEGRVTGVFMRSRQAPDAPETRLDADLVVDASGRDSHAPKWLQAHGFNAPAESVVNSQPGYATRIFAIPEGWTSDWKVVYVQPTPPHGKRGGILIPLEGNRWHVCLIGMAGDYPPTDEAGYLEFARSLPTPRLAEVIQAAQPLTPILGYRRAENRRRHYERLPRYLEGFLVTGDAACAFNPVYGQGMTVAALAALALDASLRRQREPNWAGLAQRFQKQLAQTVDGPWQMATGEDLRWPVGDEARRVDLPTRLLQAYVTRVMQAMTNNVKVIDAFYHVQNMVAQPSLLFRPDILWAVLTTPVPDAARPAPAGARPQPMAPTAARG
jgi:flavin-dependent dehydrogenase